jgi:predicted MFS family arabinose efflux permease
VLAAIGLWVTLPSGNPTAASLSDHLGIGGVLPTLSQPVVLRATLLLVLWSVVIQAVIGFYPTYLTDIKGLSIQVATVLYGFFFALGVLMKPVAGRAYDRIGVRVPLLILMSTASVGLFAFPFVSEVWLFVLLTVLASTLLGFETVVISDLTRRLPNGTQGTSLGALRMVYIALGALSPVVFGAVAD